VVNALDKEGCIMHRLYRDATHYHNGVHVKDLDRLNRVVNRIIVIDDDPEQVQFHPDNVIRVKPYTDPTDRTDTTLTRITPFLLEIAREGYNDIPALLQQYKGMDADEIADEQERRIHDVRLHRQVRSQRGLSGLATAGRRNSLPVPELPSEFGSSMGGSSSSSTRPQQLTAKDIVGQGSAAEAPTDGMVGWMNRRAKEKEEQQMRKMEKWNQVMMEKQRKRREAEKMAATTAR
jgi:mitochondrial import inner membrane translocase subunit TIM50